MGINPAPGHRAQAEAAAAKRRRALYDQALKERKEHLAANGLPWNIAEAEKFDHQWRIEHIPLPEGLSLKQPRNLLLLLLCLILLYFPLSWAYTDAFVHRNARSLPVFFAFLISLFFAAQSLARMMICAKKMKRIGPEAWLNEEAHRQKAKGIYPWNASEHAPWM